MAKPMKAPMPDNVDIGASYTLRVAALSASDGSAVAGVTISNMMLEVENLSGGDLSYGPFMLVPGPGA